MGRWEDGREDEAWGFSVNLRVRVKVNHYGWGYRVVGFWREPFEFEFSNYCSNFRITAEVSSAPLPYLGGREDGREDEAWGL